MSLFHVTILTIFPEMFPGPLQYSLAGKALKNNIWSLDVVNIRDFGLTKHKKVDDEAYGGSSGLIMRPDVLGSAIDYVLSKRPNSKIYYPSPRGTRLTQAIVHEIIQDREIIILCGRFEGIDERIIDEYNVREISVGDYILSGGEIASLAIIDCSVRLLEGVLVNQETLSAESFERNGEFLGLLECSLYTRPEEWKERKVPPTLLSGNHKMIAKWREEESLLVTKARRPDLLK